MSQRLNSQEVLKELGLGREVSPGVWKGNPDYITWLVQRELLPRVQVGPRTFRYELEDVLELKEMNKTKGTSLTMKPDKSLKAA